MFLSRVTSISRDAAPNMKKRAQFDSRFEEYCEEQKNLRCTSASKLFADIEFHTLAVERTSDA